MKILGCCRSFSANIPKLNAKMPNNAARPVSFGGAADIFCSGSSDADTIISNLKNTIDDAYSLMPEHLRSVAGLSEKAAKIQGDGAEVFESIFRQPPMRNLAKMYHEFDSTRNLRAFYEGSAYDAPNAVMFLSKDKQLAQDAASLYTFFAKAKHNQSECIGDFEKFYNMYTEGFRAHMPTIAPNASPIKDIDGCEEMIHKLTDTLVKAGSDFETTSRPSIFYVPEFTSVIDRDINSSENIANVKRLMTNTTGQYRSIFLFGAQDPIDKRLEPGALKCHRVAKKINLDNFNVTPESIEQLKKLKLQYAPQMDELDNLFAQISADDYTRMRRIYLDSLNLFHGYEVLRDQYPERFKEMKDTIDTAYSRIITMNVPQTVPKAVQTVQATVESAAKEVLTTADTAAKTVVKEAACVVDNAAQTAANACEPIQHTIKDNFANTAKKASESAQKVLKNIPGSAKIAFVVTAGVLAAGSVAYFAGKVCTNNENRKISSKL